MYRHFEIPAGTTTIYPQSWLAWQIDRATITSVAIPGTYIPCCSVFLFPVHFSNALVVMLT